jgi:NAD(P)-dependent dehydrogenase (short-subunit alcohol dehydrogenase family)
MLLNADAGHIVNTSSICGFWASAGPFVPNTAYSAAKFAVKGFTEALIADLRVNAPHIKCSVVMPGHVGTPILVNSCKIQSGRGAEPPGVAGLAQMRRHLATTGSDVSAMSDSDIQSAAVDQVRRYIEDAPTTAAQAARIILDGVKKERWRILVGEDAVRLDELVRASPDQAYDIDFYERLVTEKNWLIGR